MFTVLADVHNQYITGQIVQCQDNLSIFIYPYSMKCKISEKLKTLRNEHELTQKQVAKSLGLGESAYAKYEQGKNEPNLELVICFAKFYKTTTDYLLGLED